MKDETEKGENETLKLPEIIGSIPISEETSRNLIIYGYLYGCLLFSGNPRFLKGVDYGKQERVDFVNC